MVPVCQLFITIQITDDLLISGNDGRYDSDTVTSSLVTDWMDLFRVERSEAVLRDTVIIKKHL